MSCNATSGFRANSGDWTRGYRTVTIDTRGINAGTPEGQRALKAADEIIRRSDGFGCSLNADAARRFNADAQRVATEVRRVAETHRAETARREADDRFMREHVAKMSRR